MCGRYEWAVRAPLEGHRVALREILNDARVVWVEGRAVGSLLEEDGIDRCWPLSLQPQDAVVQIHARSATRKRPGRWRFIEMCEMSWFALFVEVGGGSMMAVCPTYRSNSALVH